MQAFTLLLAALALAAGALRAQAGMTGFEPVGDYLFQIDGKTDPTAQVYFSNAARAYLIRSEAVDTPLLVMAGMGRVDQVHLMKLVLKGDGGVDLLPGAVLGSLGPFRVEGSGVVFDLGDGRLGGLQEKPALLGPTTPQGLRDYNAEYGRLAEAYRPSDALIEELRRESREVRVVVYFGSWCPFCRQMVPRIMSVSERLEGSKIEIDFYGLPHGITSDAEARRLGITAVPTGVVYIDGEEVGRISGNGWRVPELALNNILNGS